MQCVDDTVSAEANVSILDVRKANKLAAFESNHMDLLSGRNNSSSVKHAKSEQKKVPCGLGFAVMDMVWAKVKSHPWWPGHVFSEKMATPSVRRWKRDGFLLVAFFGDSSYGWFDPSEVIPFDSNFGEKSCQTNAKDFVKAVEEAVDELSRRSALGLTCMCRNKQNFRRIEVQGYFAVDVADYEPGGVYSVDVVQKARDGFQPGLALDFVRRVALEPMVCEHGCIDFIKSKAEVVSYRRAVYEEFDETYAQAFGYVPVCPAPESIQEAAPQHTPSKAPSSRRQGFADISGKGKGSGKPNKPKVLANKDKYLFKRRDESNALKPDLKTKNKITSSFQLGRVNDDVVVLDGVLQKRDEVASKESTGTGVSMEDTPSIVKFSDPGFQLIKSNKRILSQMENRNTSSGSDDKSSNVKKAVTRYDILNSEPHKTVASHRAAGNVPTKVNKGFKDGKPDDATKDGRKRGPSDRQEEMAAQKKKKVDDIRNLTKEKRVMKKIDEPPASVRDVKQPAPTAIKKAIQRVPEPTMLMIKFPQGASLPSVNELKARFSHYGPMDHSATRIYWSKFMCRVVYRHKAHAHAAYKYVVGSSSMFGNTGVKCNLIAEPKPSAKVPKEDHFQPATENRPSSMTPATSSIQPKLIVKKYGDEEAAGRGRVKFMLGGEESQVKNKNGASSVSSIHSTVDFNCKSLQDAVLPLPTSTCVTSSTTQLTKSPLPNSRHYDTRHTPLTPTPPAGSFVDNLQRPTAGPLKEDISHQMLSLLKKCNEVVTNMTNILGYAPYHPL